MRLLTAHCNRGLFQVCSSPLEGSPNCPGDAGGALVEEELGAAWTPSPPRSLQGTAVHVSPFCSPEQNVGSLQTSLLVSLPLQTAWGHLTVVYPRGIYAHKRWWYTLSIDFRAKSDLDIKSEWNKLLTQAIETCPSKSYVLSCSYSPPVPGGTWQQCTGVSANARTNGQSSTQSSLCMILASLCITP